MCIPQYIILNIPDTLSQSYHIIMILTKYILKFQW